MKITKGMVENLLHLIGAGIQTGAGNMTRPGTFCIQQAVSMSVGAREYNDRPTLCVNPVINAWGVAMNDQQWKSPTSRADGMKRFAVAELGSLKVDEKKWERLVIQKWVDAEKYRYVSSAGSAISDCRCDSDRKELCNIAADALAELGSEGSQYLYLLDPTTPQAHREFMHRMYNPIPQLTWRGFGAQSQKGNTRNLA